MNEQNLSERLKTAVSIVKAVEVFAGVPVASIVRGLFVQFGALTPDDAALLERDYAALAVALAESRQQAGS